MDISTEQIENGIIVRVSGFLGSKVASEFDKALLEVLDIDVHRVIVDMAEVDFISSACIRTFLLAYKRILSEGRFMELTRTQPAVRKVMIVVGLDELLAQDEGTA